MQVSKWGNSLAVRLPAAVVEQLQLTEGDQVEIVARSTRTFEVSRQPGPKELLETIRRFQGRVPLDFRFDRDEANER